MSLLQSMVSKRLRAKAQSFFYENCPPTEMVGLVRDGITI